MISKKSSIVQVSLVSLLHLDIFLKFYQIYINLNTIPLNYIRTSFDLNVKISLENL